MQHWHVDRLDPGTEKLEPRAPGPDAPRTPAPAHDKPQVLFAHPECRGVVVPLAAGGEMGDHSVRERAVVTVLFGRVEIECGDVCVDAGTGTVVCFDPGERHSVRAHEESRLLLVLSGAPASARAHGEERLPPNATAEPHEPEG